MEEKKYEVVLKIFVLQIAAIVMILPFVWLVSTESKALLKFSPETLT